MRYKTIFEIHQRTQPASAFTSETGTKPPHDLRSPQNFGQFTFPAISPGKEGRLSLPFENVFDRLSSPLAAVPVAVPTPEVG
jgi:hypothetical protein